MVSGSACAPRAVARCSRPADARVASGLPHKPRFIFPAKNRLKRRAEFQKVYSRGIRVAGRHMVFFVMPAEGKENRFGVTASRRVGGAVIRSRCKRRLRELYRLYRHQHEGPPLEIVVNARHGCAMAAWPELVRDFQACYGTGMTRVGRG